MVRCDDIVLSVLELLSERERCDRDEFIGSMACADACMHGASGTAVQVPVPS